MNGITALIKSLAHFSDLHHQATVRHSEHQMSQIANASVAAKNANRLHWDAIASDMPDYFATPTTQYYRRREIELIKRSFGDLQGKKVLKLDLWNEAINTRILHWMCSQGADVFAVDVSHVVTSRARNNAEQQIGALHFSQADMRNLPFGADVFDFVYTMGTIEHILEYRQALDEVHRVMVPGGTAIIGVPDKWNLYLRPVMVHLLDSIGKYAFSPEKSFSASELAGLLQEAGFEVGQRDGILAIPPVLRMADLFLFRRHNPLHYLSKYLVAPFEFAEIHWPVLAKTGYLMAMVAGKPKK